MKRSYSVQEIGIMRYVVASSIPLTGLSHQERTIEIEEKLRTYMVAGIDPIDFAEHINGTFFSNGYKNMSLQDTTDHRAAMV